MGATFTSFYFLCFYVCVLVFYYLVPQKARWGVLLVFSIAYYLLSGNGALIFYPIAACFVAWLGIRKLSGATDQAVRKRVLAAVTGLLIGILVLLKYVNFGVHTVNVLVPLGISFYTFTVLGYVIDVYNGIAPFQKSFRKLLLYGMYFPTILSGPILRYREDGEQFFKPHRLDYKQVTFGLQRMLWGFFQTLVISERMNLIVNTVYDNYQAYGGAYCWVATVCFAFQLYTNFSGCMDIVLGMSETFGIKLPENFRTPYFSKNISEYWRRWHITLGVWMKEYVFYPLLRTSFFAKLGKKTKQRFGKKLGKQLTTFTAMFLLWFTVGIWHGGDWKYIIGSGLLHWFYIVMGEFTAPCLQKWMKKLQISEDSRWLNGFRMVRTFFLVNIGFVFFRAESAGAAIAMLKSMFTMWNPEVIFSEAIFTLGLDWVEMTVAIVSLLILFLVSFLREKGIAVREQISRKRLPIRWGIWYALLFYTILLGYYGPGYSAAEFIYQGF